jgi:prevent-host-death family protein
MLIVNTHQAKSQLSKLIEYTLAGEDVIIARAGRPVVKLIPHRAHKKYRTIGKYKGKIWMAPDFNEESDEINTLFGTD